MSTDKGGSDLDVFNDLKPQTPDGKPILETKKTLMGIALPEGSLPPVPGNNSGSSIPPPNGTVQGAGFAGAASAPGHRPASSPTSSRSVPPPPPSQRPRRPPGPPPSRPRPSRTGEGERTEDANTPTEPPSSRKEGFGLGLDSWATTQPGSAAPRITLPPQAPPGRTLDALPPSGLGAPALSASAGSSPALSSTALSAGGSLSAGSSGGALGLPSAALAPSAAASAAAAAAAAQASEPGWDDDDDKTTVYDKDTQAAAHSLLQPVRQDLLGRPPPPMSRPPGAFLPPGVLAPGMALGGRATAPPAPQDAVFSMPPQPANNQRFAYALAFAGALIVALLLWFMLPKKGALTVTVAGGPGNRELSAVEVIVDNKLRCRTSPCEIPSLKAGTHYVQVRAAGYQATAQSAVAVLSGQTAVHNVQLIRAGTGIKVFGEGTGLTLLVDGKEFGPLPQELREMEPGDHVIQITGGPRYEVFQQRITVDADRMIPIGPIRLKVLKGLATIRAGEGAEDAEVTLKVGDSRRVLPPLPVRLEVEADRPHVLIARRKGYVPFEQPILFDDGQAEKTIEVTLTERASDDAARRRRAGPGSRSEDTNEVATDTESPAPAPAPALDTAPSASGTLTFTSTPPSNVLLDGKPLGTTPLRNVSVDPGQHRVILIHGAQRKPQVVDIAAGGARTVTETFTGG